MSGSPSTTETKEFARLGQATALVELIQLLSVRIEATSLLGTKPHPSLPGWRFASSDVLVQATTSRSAGVRSPGTNAELPRPTTTTTQRQQLQLQQQRREQGEEELEVEEEDPKAVVIAKLKQRRAALEQELAGLKYGQG